MGWTKLLIVLYKHRIKLEILLAKLEWDKCNNTIKKLRIRFEQAHPQPKKDTYRLSASTSTHKKIPTNLVKSQPQH